MVTYELEQSCVVFWLSNLQLAVGHFAQAGLLRKLKRPQSPVQHILGRSAFLFVTDSQGPQK